MRKKQSQVMLQLSGGQAGWGGMYSSAAEEIEKKCKTVAIFSTKRYDEESVNGVE
jgi:hypothetical protein